MAVSSRSGTPKFGSDYDRDAQELSNVSSVRDSLIIPAERRTSKNSSARSSFDAPPAFVSKAAEEDKKAGSSPLPAWALILLWISLSTAVIFQNASILKDRDFPYPITLTSIHLLFQTIFTRLLARFTNLIPLADLSGAKSKSDYTPLPTVSPRPGSTAAEGEVVKVNGEIDYFASSDASSPVLPSEGAVKSWSFVSRDALFWRSIVPIGLLFSLSLVLSNWVYMFLSVSFIQMIKAASPCAVLIASFAFRLREPSLKLIVIMVSISAGVGLASYGEADFNLFGFIVQLLAIGVEACRLALIEILLSGVGLSPLQSLHAFAPVCLAFLSLMILPFEGFAPFFALSHLGIPLIILNASLTCALNLSSIYLIGISSVVLSLSKVIKDILIILASALALGTPITALQWLGYGIALGGMYVYKTYA